MIPQLLSRELTGRSDRDLLQQLVIQHAFNQSQSARPCMTTVVQSALWRDSLYMLGSSDGFEGSCLATRRWTYPVSHYQDCMFLCMEKGVLLVEQRGERCFKFSLLSHRNGECLDAHRVTGPESVGNLYSCPQVDRFRWLATFSVDSGWETSCVEMSVDPFSVKEVITLGSFGAYFGRESSDGGRFTVIRRDQGIVCIDLLQGCQMDSVPDRWKVIQSGDFFTLGPSAPISGVFQSRGDDHVIFLREGDLRIARLPKGMI